MELYTTEKLSEDLLIFKTNIGRFSSPYFSLFTLLFNTGLRINEALNFDRWDISDLKNILIVTEKKSNPRFITLSDFDDYGQVALLNGWFPFPYMSFDTATYYFKLYYPKSRVFHKKKPITTHLFRHYKIKKMSELGFTVEEISNYIGERDNKNTSSYINSQLYYV